MRAVKGKDTCLELTVAAAMTAQRWRYERNVGELPGKPDFVFRRQRTVVFIDGDFWHGWRFPRWRDKLPPYWQQKIERNRRRDRSNFQKLRRTGWRVIRVWGHEMDRDLDAVVARIADATGLVVRVR
ncbi:MAG: very short patch repair endonuclease [Planctomycetota bacterium]|nr:very short patch repair endonuclease [Planctomycetota bacterium]